MNLNSKHTYTSFRTILLFIVSFFMSLPSLNAQKFSACGTDSIWRAYLVDRRTEEVIENYLPEDFFSGSGGALPDFESNTNPYLVPKFVFDMQSCDLDSFEIHFRYRNSDKMIPGRVTTTQSEIWFTIQEELEFNADDVLRSKPHKKLLSVTATDTSKIEAGLRYSWGESEMWFKYKDGVITKSGGEKAHYNICTLDLLSLTWDNSGGMITYMSVKINDDFYEEDFSDCSNAMVYKECPPKEPDFVKIICEKIPDCKTEIYRFYTESNLDEIHWIGEGLTYEGTTLELLQDQFNGGCVAVWAQKDPCTPPVYDTICPPKIELREKVTEYDETICWDESFFVHGKRVTQSGTYEEVYKAANGCDSIIRYNVTVNTGDTTYSDTVYRCGVRIIKDSTFICDTIYVEGACPDMNMAPIGKPSQRNHVAIGNIREERDEVKIDVFNNLGNITYTTIWMGHEEDKNESGELTFDKAGMYKIIAYDEETGCKDSMSFYYRTPVTPDFYFCPDDSDDGKWDIKGIEKYTNYRIYIYDRFGRRLEAYENEFDGWNGIYNGRPMPSTDYWYTIEIDEGDYSLQGHFTLIRQSK